MLLQDQSHKRKVLSWSRELIYFASLLLTVIIAMLYGLASTQVISVATVSSLFLGFVGALAMLALVVLAIGLKDAEVFANDCSKLQLYNKETCLRDNWAFLTGNALHILERFLMCIVCGLGIAELYGLGVFLYLVPVVFLCAVVRSVFEIISIVPVASKMETSHLQWRSKIEGLLFNSFSLGLAVCSILAIKMPLLFGSITIGGMIISGSLFIPCLFLPLACGASLYMLGKTGYYTQLARAERLSSKEIPMQRLELPRRNSITESFPSTSPVYSVLVEELTPKIP